MPVRRPPSPISGFLVDATGHLMAEDWGLAYPTAVWTRVTPPPPNACSSQTVVSIDFFSRGQKGKKQAAVFQSSLELVKRVWRMAVFSRVHMPSSRNSS